MQIYCEHPRIILNPKAPELLLRYRHWILNGREYKAKFYSRHMLDFIFHDFSPRRNNITLDNFEQQVIIDDSTGESYMLYLAVPCGHCDICKVSKINSFVFRCNLESQMYNSLPWFITLTYAHAPEDGVSVRDCQLFLKRFRINLQRSGFDYHIRYFLVSEYGTTGTMRPHYHAIIWGINSFTPDDVRKVSSIISKSWQHGFVTSRFINLSNPDDKSMYYTAKYIKKVNNVPEGKNPNFSLQSRGNGGIGSGFIDKHSEKIRKSLNIHYSYRDKWTGIVKPFQWCSYVLNRLFPSWCRSVDRHFRNDLNYFLYLFRQYFDIMSVVDNALCKSLLDFISAVHNRLDKFMFVPEDFVVSCPNHSIYNPDEIVSYKERIEQGLCDIDFSFSFVLDGLRKKFLGRLFLFDSRVDLKRRSQQCRDILSWESPKTIHV